MQVSNAARRSEPVAGDATPRAERGGMVVKRLKYMAVEGYSKPTLLRRTGLLQRCQSEIGA